MHLYSLMHIIIYLHYPLPLILTSNISMNPETSQRSCKCVYTRMDIYIYIYIYIYIRCTTLLPPLFSEIRGFIIKNWLYIYDSKYCPSLVTTFSYLSGSVRILCRKNWSSFEAIHESIQFFTSSIRPEVLVSQVVCHWSKHVIVRGSNVWRIRRVG